MMANQNEKKNNLWSFPFLNRFIKKLFSGYRQHSHSLFLSFIFQIHANVCESKEKDGANRREHNKKYTTPHRKCSLSLKKKFFANSRDSTMYTYYSMCSVSAHKHPNCVCVVYYLVLFLSLSHSFSVAASFALLLGHSVVTLSICVRDRGVFFFIKHTVTLYMCNTSKDERST